VQRNVSENGRERGIRIDRYPLRVASDVDDGLEEPKHSANHVIMRDADEICPNFRKYVCVLPFSYEIYLLNFKVFPLTLKTPLGEG